MLNFCKKIITAAGFLSLLACSSSPPNVTSSLPLISAELGSPFLAVSSEISDALNTQQTSIRTLGKEYHFSKPYFSALGLHCVQMKEKNNSLSVCKVDGQWKMLPSTDAK